MSKGAIETQDSLHCCSRATCSTRICVPIPECLGKCLLARCCISWSVLASNYVQVTRECKQKRSEPLWANLVKKHMCSLYSSLLSLHGILGSHTPKMAVAQDGKSLAAPSPYIEKAACQGPIINTIIYKNLPYRKLPLIRDTITLNLFGDKIRYIYMR